MCLGTVSASPKIQIWGNVPGIRCLTPGTWYQVLGTRTLVLGKVPGTRCTWYQVPGTWCQVPGTGKLVPGTWYLASGTWNWYQVPGT